MIDSGPSALQLAGAAIVDCEHKIRALVPPGEHRTRALLKLMEAWFWARHQLDCAQIEANQIEKEASRIIKP